MCRVLAWHKGSNKNLKISEEKKVKKLIKGLLLAEAGSNPDGTGLLSVKARKEGDKVYLLKRGVNALKFLVREEEKVNFMLDDAKMVIGHVRYATKGEVNDGNSHPFMFRVKGKVFAGVHNGVIDYESLVKKALSLNIKNPKWFEVDSFLLFACIAKLLRQDKPIEEAVETVLKDVNGSWALIMYWDGKIYFVKSMERPLWVCDLRSKGLGRFIASTQEMFKKACEIAGENFTDMPEFEAVPYRLYMITENGDVETVKDLDIKPVIRVPRVPARIWNDWDNYGYGYGYNYDWNISDYYEDFYFSSAREVEEALEEVETEIEDVREQIAILENEFSDDPEQVYMLTEAEEQLKELLKKRRKLKNILKKLKGNSKSKSKSKSKSRKKSKKFTIQ